MDPWADSLRLVAGAQLTLTVAGTIAFEAGLLGYPATTFTEMYFSPLLLTTSVNPYDSSLRSLIARLGGSTANVPELRQRVRFMADLFANSRPGLIGAPDDTPECITPTNVAQVAAGLEELIPAALARDI